MSRQKHLLRIEAAMVELGRMTRSGRADRLRCERAGVEVTGAAQRLIYYLMENGPMRLSELARRTETDPGILTRQVNTLAAQGIVEKRPDPTDRRAVTVQMLPKGRRIAQRLREVQDEVLGSQLARWASSDLEQAAGLMEQLISDIRPKWEGETGDESE
ncbi:MarR family transcriptional regulator [Myxococcota bacterium]|nr:MarR family transcriptional regulator [Myxococcota bacterium]